MKITITAILNKRKIPLTCTFIDDIIEVQFPFYRPMLDEIKAMERPPESWDSERKIWRIMNTRRNLFALDILMYGPRSQIYYDKVRNFNPPAYFWIHQQEDYNFIKTRHSCLIAGEMRVGKTLPTLRVAEEIDGPVWWVAPTKVIRGIRIEMEKWKVRKNIKLCTYASLRSFDGTPPVGGVPMMVVFDECQKLKSPNSQQTQGAMALSDAMHKCYDGKEYIVGLSGTPSPKNPGDWWSQLEVIKPGFIRESSRRKFEFRYGEFEEFDPAPGQRAWRLKNWKENELKALTKRLKPIVNIHLKKDCLDLPPLTYEVVDLPPSKMMLRVAKTIADNAQNTLTAITQLRQLSDGFQYNYSYDEVRNVKFRDATSYTGSPKSERLKDDLEEHSDVGRIVIYAGFHGSLDIISDICLGLGWVVLYNISEVRIPDDYEFDTPTVDYCLKQMDRSINDGTLTKLAVVATAESGGLGLEFSAAPTSIFYSNTNKGEARMQAEARAHSANMDINRGHRILDYCHLPIDYKIAESLKNKKDLQSLTMGAIKELFDVHNS